jgi:hypothetical protein
MPLTMPSAPPACSRGRFEAREWLAYDRSEERWHGVPLGDVHAVDNALSTASLQFRNIDKTSMSTADPKTEAVTSKAVKGRPFIKSVCAVCAMSLLLHVLGTHDPIALCFMANAKRLDIVELLLFPASFPSCVIVCARLSCR